MTTCAVFLNSKLIWMKQMLCRFSEESLIQIYLHFDYSGACCDCVQLRASWHSQPIVGEGRHTANPLLERVDRWKAAQKKVGSATRAVRCKHRANPLLDIDRWKAAQQRGGSLSRAVHCKYGRSVHILANVSMSQHYHDSSLSSIISVSQIFLFQIYIFYGARSNSQFLIHSGFVYPENENDRLPLKLGIAKTDQLFRLKSAVLNKCGISVYVVIADLHIWFLYV
jgi:hypothetical protein